MIHIEHPGLLTTLQDAGRFGAAHLGIGRSGAADLPAMRLANALVGNPLDTPVLEMTLLGATLQFDDATHIAVTGAPLPHATLNGQPFTGWQSCPVPAGSRLQLGPMGSGCRSYLAVAGGFTVEPWLGSCATDINAALGPYPQGLAAGDSLTINRPATALPSELPKWFLDAACWFDDLQPRTIRLLPATHTESLSFLSNERIKRREFTVSTASNRTGILLDSPSLMLKEPQEVVSAGVVPGLVQLPPGGYPIIMGPEHPVTGGYPRIAQVAAVDLPRIAQCRPGDRLRFMWIDQDEAAQLLKERQKTLSQLLMWIAQRLEAA